MGYRVNITKKFTAEAEHYLPNHPGKCKNRHGHSYKIWVTVSGLIASESKRIACQANTATSTEMLKLRKQPLNISDYMVMDFSELKGIVEPLIDTCFDHQSLNEIIGIPTAEIMAIYIYECVKEMLPMNDRMLKVENVRVWETENAYADYAGGSREI